MKKKDLTLRERSALVKELRRSLNNGATLTQTVADIDHIIERAKRHASAGKPPFYRTAPRGGKK